MSNEDEKLKKKVWNHSLFKLYVWRILSFHTCYIFQLYRYIGDTGDWCSLAYSE